jgi:aminotransferase
VSSLPGQNSKERAMYLLNQTGVASVPGESFYKGAEGKGIVRFCFAKEDDVIEDACRRLEALQKVQSQQTG